MAPILDRLMWRLTAPVYDRFARTLNPAREWAADTLDIGSDDRVLLLGCGTGLDLEYVPADAAVVAVDHSRSMVRRCGRRGAAMGADLETIVSDARSVPRPDDSFDAVLIHLLLSVTDAPEAIIEEASRLLRNGGRLSILDEPPRSATLPTRRAMLRNAGLEAQGSRSFGGWVATVASLEPGRSRSQPNTGR